MTNARPDFRGNPLDYIGFFEDVTSNFGDWVANGTPEPDSIPAAIQQRYRDICDDYSNAPSWLSNLGTPSRKTISNVCSPWLATQGSGDPVLELPFEGGQCPGVQYEIRLRLEANKEDCGGGGTEAVVPREDTLTGFGPLGAPFIREDLASDCGARTVRACVPAFDSSGNPIEICTQQITTGRPDERLIDQSISVVFGPNRVDGQPDDCGNLPGGEPGPNPNPRPDPGLDPEDEPFEREPGQPRLPMPTIPDPFGDPIQLPNFPLPRIDGPSLFPEDDPPLAEPGQPGTPETVSGDEEVSGEAGEGETLTGVLVTVNSVPGFARVVQNVSEPTYIGACYVYLGWDGQLDLQPEGQFLVTSQFFAAIPGMTHWLVRSAVGYTLTITPYYAPKD